MLVWFLWLLACGSEERHVIPYTTTRIGEPVLDTKTDAKVQILYNKRRCEHAISLSNTPKEKRQEELKNCLPWFDRANGEVKLSFSFIVDNEQYPLPLSRDHLDVTHDGFTIGEPTPGEKVEIIPHAPLRVPQLFVLMIDASESMKQVDGKAGSPDRMAKVRRALLLPEVRKAFLPNDSGAPENAVVIFTFTSGRPQPLGGRVRVITSAKEYTSLISQNLWPRNGYTHLYNAVQYGSQSVFKQRLIKKWLDDNLAARTVVVLTDGFNNVSSSQKCSDNVKPLKKLLDHLAMSRQGTKVNVVDKPTVYTVGLGRRLQKKFKLPSNRSRVNARTLCGKYRNQTIDANLETKGIDNGSLKWIAAVGGGESFVTNRIKDLGAAFRQTAAKRFQWFEVRYKTSPLRMRQSFTTQLTLKTFSIAKSHIKLYPHGWFDPPPGKKRKDGWTESTGYLHIMTVLLPPLGLLLFLSILGAAFYNIRRVLLGRLRRPPPLS